VREWLDSLETRERNVVIGGAAAVLFIVLYGFVWVPLDRGHDARRESVTTWERSLVDLVPLKARAAVPNASSGRRPSSTQTPVVIIDQTLRARSLDQSLKRSQPTTSTGIRVEFENVAFDDLMLWLGDLSSNYAMDVQAGSFSATTRSAPGRVNASLTLERAN
jgi:general secretion pathway protein M